MIEKCGAIVADLVRAGFEAVEAFCPSCGNIWLAPIAFLPPKTTIETISALMACPVCEGRQIEVSPASNTTPQQ